MVERDPCSAVKWASTEIRVGVVSVLVYSELGKMAGLWLQRGKNEKESVSLIYIMSKQNDRKSREYAQTIEKLKKLVKYGCLADLL